MARLIKGDFKKEKVYDLSPLDLAKQFESIGIQKLHLVDLDGAKKGRIVNYPTLETLAGHTSLKINFTGGLAHRWRRQQSLLIWCRQHHGLHCFYLSSRIIQSLDDFLWARENNVGCG